MPPATSRRPLLKLGSRLTTSAHLQPIASTLRSGFPLPRGVRQARENGRHVEPAIESILRLCQIEEAVLVEIERVISATGSSLQLAQYGIDPSKARHVAAPAGLSDDFRGAASRI